MPQNREHVILRYLLPTLLLCPFAAQAQHVVPPGPRAPYRLVEVASYGTADYRASPSDDELTRRARGDMFGRIGELRVDPEGREVFALDNLGQKLVAITPDGRSRVVMTWREGKGPGEMIRPRGFAFTSDGFVMTDMAQPRLSFFSREGRFQRMQPLAASAINIIETPGGFALMRVSVAQGREQLLFLDAAGVVIDSTLRITGRRADFAPYGEAGELFLDRSRRPMVASPAAGMWCSLERTGRCVGADLFPTVRGTIQRRGSVDVRGVPVGVRGAAELGSGETVILVMTIAEEPIFSLLVFDAKRTYVGYVALDAGWSFRMTRGFGERDILLVADHPFPRIVRYELRPS